MDRYNVENSKLAFVNLLAYGHFHGARVTFEGDTMVVLSFPAGQRPAIFPPLVPKEKLKTCVERLRTYFFEEFGEPLRVRDSDTEFIYLLKSNGIDFERIEVRGQWEYIYRAKDLRTLSGRKLHKKKNRVNKFLKAHPTYSSRLLKAKDRDAVLAFFKEWCKQKGCDNDENLLRERESIARLFCLMDKLPVKGIISFVDGVVRGFSIGTYLRKGIFVVMVEKADLSKEFEGLYAIVRRDTARIAASDCEFINLQQDLNIPGIRKAKLSWKPCKILVCDTLIL
ncbi:DUF2156 domain-containing protein [Kosmotoga pacifica]|uniref:DUF2156 domain-containing protein n=1 Tax=Kosmotoga pacifica TaxID=1330330 RepID=UPI0023532945|nr:phosphatidylglycerol lysyltransferase domain-containing protein [Kosmotoga pacifica]